MTNFKKLTLAAATLATALTMTTAAFGAPITLSAGISSFFGTSVILNGSMVDFSPNAPSPNFEVDATNVFTIGGDKGSLYDFAYTPNGSNILPSSLILTINDDKNTASLLDDTLYSFFANSVDHSMNGNFHNLLLTGYMTAVGLIPFDNTNYILEISTQVQNTFSGGLTQTPEPSMTLLFGGALLGAIAYRRKMSK